MTNKTRGSTPVPKPVAKSEMRAPRAPRQGQGQRERLRRMKQAGLIPKTLKLGA